MTNDRLSFILFLGTAVVWAGCGAAAPFGMYWHSPQRLEQMQPEDQQIEVPAPRPDAPVVVLKRFDNRARTPVGARYEVVAKSEPGSKAEQRTAEGIDPSFMVELYTPSRDLGLPLYEAVTEQLAAAGYQVWTDFDPNRHAIKGPPGLSQYVVLHAVLTHLEIDSFYWRSEPPDGKATGPTHDEGTGPIHDAAIAHLEVQLLGHDGRQLSATPVEVALRVNRESGDILGGVANRLAVQLAHVINREAQ